MLKFQNVAKLKYFRIFLIVILLVSCREENIIDFPFDEAPQIPMGFSIYGAYDGMIGLEWIKNNNSDSYKIYRSINDTSNFIFLATTKSNNYLDIDLDYESTYYYKMKAVTFENKESGFTKIVFASPKNIYYPTRPVIDNITAKNNNGSLSITLNWFQNYDTDIDFYEIYRDTSNSFSLEKPTIKVKSLFFEDKENLKPLQNYYYKIVAVDKGGLKSQPTFSAPTRILDLPIPIFPSNESIIKSLNEFKFITCSERANYTLIIQDNDSNVTIKEYQISSNKKKEIVSLPLNNLSLKPGNKYLWKIVAYLSNSSEPNSITDFFKFTIESQ